jgi:hypothetical protein
MDIEAVRKSKSREESLHQEFEENSASFYSSATRQSGNTLELSKVKADTQGEDLL